MVEAAAGGTLAYKEDGLGASLVSLLTAAKPRETIEVDEVMLV